MWQGSINKKGYATLGGSWARKSGRSILAHRVSWEDANQSIVPHGYTVDHLCRTRSCVNPDHLEAVPHSENVRRGTKTKINEGAVLSILRHAAEMRSTSAIARAHGISVGQAQQIIHGHSWTDIESPYRKIISDKCRTRWNIGPIDEVLVPYTREQAGSTDCIAPQTKPSPCGLEQSISCAPMIP